MPWKFISPTSLKSLLLPWWTEIMCWLLHHQTSLQSLVKIYSSAFPLYLFMIIRQYNLVVSFIVCCKVSICKQYWFPHRKLPLRIGKKIHFEISSKIYNVPSLHTSVSTWGFENLHIINFAPVLGGIIMIMIIITISSIKSIKPVFSLSWCFMFYLLRVRA